jgi:putative transposase
MSRRKLLKIKTHPYHVTVRANNRDRFHLSMNRFWDVIGDRCLFLKMVYGVEFQAVVLMPNHLHIILTVPEFDLGFVMNELLKSISRTSNLLTGRTGHLFGGPYHWSLINSSRYFGHALKYVYRNPVKAGLCQKVEDYPFSTLQGLLGQTHLRFPLYYTRVGMESALPAIEPLLQLDWLNTPVPAEADALIQKGLRRKVFDSILDRVKRKETSVLDALV